MSQRKRSGKVAVSAVASGVGGMVQGGDKCCKVRCNFAHLLGSSLVLYERLVPESCRTVLHIRSKVRRIREIHPCGNVVEYVS
jgi:hypothetical protein